MCDKGLGDRLVLAGTTCAGGPGPGEQSRVVCKLRGCLSSGPAGVPGARAAGPAAPRDQAAPARGARTRSWTVDSKRVATRCPLLSTAGPPGSLCWEEPGGSAQGAAISWDWGAWVTQHPCECRPPPRPELWPDGWTRPQGPRSPHLAVLGVQGGRTPQTPVMNVGQRWPLRGCSGNGGHHPPTGLCPEALSTRPPDGEQGRGGEDSAESGALVTT